MTEEEVDGIMQALADGQEVRVDYSSDYHDEFIRSEQKGRIVVRNGVNSVNTYGSRIIRDHLRGSDISQVTISGEPSPRQKRRPLL